MRSNQCCHSLMCNTRLLCLLCLIINVCNVLDCTLCILNICALSFLYQSEHCFTSLCSKDWPSLSSRSGSYSPQSWKVQVSNPYKVSLSPSGCLVMHLYYSHFSCTLMDFAINCSLFSFCLKKNILFIHFPLCLQSAEACIILYVCGYFVFLFFVCVPAYLFILIDFHCTVALVVVTKALVLFYLLFHKYAS